MSKFIYPAVDTKTNQFEEAGFIKWQPVSLADQIKARYAFLSTRCILIEKEHEAKTDAARPWDEILAK